MLSLTQQYTENVKVRDSLFFMSSPIREVKSYFPDGLPYGSLHFHAHARKVTLAEDDNSVT